MTEITTHPKLELEYKQINPDLRDVVSYIAKLLTRSRAGAE